MPIMSGLERGFCANPVWDAITGSVVVPRVFDGVDLHGDVLELGSGAGANAAALLARNGDIRVTLTDLDSAMRARAERRVAPCGDRARVLEADATALDFADASFDAVVSMLMLHHVVDWETAVGEIARVLRPGGIFVGYDLRAGFGAKAIHVADRSEHRLVAPDELAAELERAGFDEVSIDSFPGVPLMRFRARLGGEDAW